MKQPHHPEGAVFAPLVAALLSGRYLRVVARPGWVTGDPPFGPCLALPDTAWQAEQHARACAACAEPIVVGEGVVAAAVGDGVVVSQVPQAFLPADLVRDQVISPLAMRLLSAASGMGRNVLLAGPHNAALPLMYALVGEGARPAMLDAPSVPVPQRWLRPGNAEDAARAGADRIGVCTVSAFRLVEATGTLCGVVALAAARRMEQALMRYELGSAVGGDGHNAPLHVLAGVDFVVQVGVHEVPHVNLVAEIVLTETGYRPHILFSAGLPPMPRALIPRAAPSFLQDLVMAGHGGLAEELALALPDASPGRVAPPAAPVQAGTPAARSSERGERGGRSSRADERASRPPFAPRPWPGPKVVPKPADVPPDSIPGWELDRLPAPEAEVGRVGVASADDAMLAATYGLAPPPRPAGTRARTFDEVMARAHPVAPPPAIASAPPSVPENSSDSADTEAEALPYLPPDDGADDAPRNSNS